MQGIGLRGVGIGGARLAGGGLVYLLRDEFTTAEAAPLASPRTCEPGPGTLTITDTENKLSVSGGNLVCAGGKATPAWADPGAWGSAFARAVGRAFLTGVNFAGNGQCELGFESAPAANTTEVINFGDAALLVSYAAGNTLSVATVANGIDYKLAAIQRSAGTFYAIRGGAFTNWTLLWVGAAINTATLYPGIVNKSRAFSVPYCRVLDLPSPFSTDFGLATQRLAGARAAGDTFVHEADCIIEWTQTTLSSGETDVRFRRQDAANYWTVKIGATGTLYLYEVVANSGTLRGSAATVVANGDRVVIICEGSTIRVYEANTLRITYTSATNFSTATGGLLAAIGAGDAVSDIVSWPRTLSGSAAAILDQASA